MESAMSEKEKGPHPTEVTAGATSEQTIDAEPTEAERREIEALRQLLDGEATPELDAGDAEAVGLIGTTRGRPLPLGDLKARSIARAAVGEAVLRAARRGVGWR